MNYDYQQRDNVEDAILGAILVDNDKKAYPEGMYQLFIKHGIDNPNCFRTKFNQDVFATILLLLQQDLPVDLITVCSLRPAEYRDPNNLSWSNNFEINCITLTQKISSSAHIEHHIMLLKQYVIIDFWNNKSNEILEGYWDNRDIFTVTDNIINGHNMLLDNFNKNIKVNTNTDIVKSVREKREKTLKGELVTVPIGVSEMDVFSGGWQGSELSIIGARPGMGKTTISLILAKNSSFLHNTEGVFITLEMTRLQLMNKIISSETGISYQDIKNFRTTEEEFQKILWWYDYFDKTSKLRIYDLNDCRTLGQIVDRIKQAKPKFVVIDYLQLVKLDKHIQKNGNREQEVSEISRNLKTLALELDIPVIALSQLSRALETRSNKRPMLSDLRESGSLEQDADNVIFLYRQAYYDETAGREVPEVEKGNMEWIWAKGRETGIRTFMINADFKNYQIAEGFKYNSDVPAPPPPPP